MPLFVTGDFHHQDCVQGRRNQHAHVTNQPRRIDAPYLHRSITDCYFWAMYVALLTIPTYLSPHPTQHRTWKPPTWICGLPKIRELRHMRSVPSERVPWTNTNPGKLFDCFLAQLTNRFGDMFVLHESRLVIFPITSRLNCPPKNQNECNFLRFRKEAEFDDAGHAPLHPRPCPHYIHYFTPEPTSRNTLYVINQSRWLRVESV